MTPAALATLDQVPAVDARRGWRLLEARALTADRRGLAALALLADAGPTVGGELAEVEWARALAALDAATAYRGRHNLPSADRDEAAAGGAAAPARRRRRAGVDADRRARALRRLFIELSDDGPFDEAMDVLRRLRLADPADSTGARYLWDLGWSQYAARNYSGAVGYWAELAALYPESRYARAGRYWTARSFEALGEPERARERLRRDRRRRDHRLLPQVRPRPPRRRARRPSAGAARRRSRASPGPKTPPSPAPSCSPTSASTTWRWPRSTPSAAAPSRGRPARSPPWSAPGAANGWRASPQIRRAFPSLGGPFQMRLPREALRIYYPLDYEEIIRAQAAQAAPPARPGVRRHPPGERLRTAGARAAPAPAA